MEGDEVNGKGVSYFFPSGKTVLSVEYLTRQDLIDQYYPLAEERDYIPYATVRDLDELRINAGHEPPPNTINLSPDPRAGQPFTLSLFPRPGNASLRIVVNLDHPRTVRLSIFDVAGRTVSVLCDGLCPSGENAWTWKAPQQSGGVYFVGLETEGSRTVAKALILK